MLGSRKAQAVIELAILGSLIIMAFAIVISSSENYNRAQSYMQQTFRSTLLKAQEANDTGAVTAVDFRRMPNVTTPVEVGALARFSSGNSVLWSDGKKKDGEFTESKAWFLHHRSRYEFLEAGPPGAIPGASIESSFNYGSGLGSDSTYIKRENSRNINTQKHLEASDNVTDHVVLGSNTVTTGGPLGPGGLYGGEVSGLTRDTVNTVNQ